MDLFRKEAVRHAARLEGDVLLTTPISARNLSLVTLAILAACIVFAGFAQFPRRQVANGWLAPDRGLVTLSSAGGGQVDRILAHEGDLVTAGQAIVEVSLGDTAGQDPINRRLAAALTAEDSGLTSRLSQDLAKLGNERRRLGSQIDTIDGRRLELGRRRDIEVQRLALARKGVTRAEALAEKGYGSQGAIEARRSDALALEASISALNEQDLALLRERGDAQTAMLSLPAEAARLRADFLSQQTVRIDRGAASDARESFQAISPVDGSVLAVPLREGQTAPPGAPLAMILPGGSQLEAEMFLPSRAIGTVEVGQRVLIAVAAFPAARFGHVGGTIKSISQAPLSPREASGGRLSSTDPGFRVRVALDRQHIRVGGRQAALQPGMDFSASILLERRSILEWLLGPLLLAGRGV